MRKKSGSTRAPAPPQPAPRGSRPWPSTRPAPRYAMTPARACGANVKPRWSGKTPRYGQPPEECPVSDIRPSTPERKTHTSDTTARASQAGGWVPPQARRDFDAAIRRAGERSDSRLKDHDDPEPNDLFHTEAPPPGLWGQLQPLTGHTVALASAAGRCRRRHPGPALSPKRQRPVATAHGHQCHHPPATDPAPGATERPPARTQPRSNG